MFHLGLIGYPLGHSLSPRLHEAALQCLVRGHNEPPPGDYTCFPVLPLPEGADQLAELLTRLRRGELHGLNVTIPHKQAVRPFLDGLTPAAAAIGAVNTIVPQNGELIGENTDAPGFLTDLERLGWLGKGGDEAPVALVLGAGGAARAVVYGLLKAGWQVQISSRRPEQAEAMRGIFEGPVTVLPDLHGGIRPETALIVNATPVGMWPEVEASPWPSGLPFPPGSAVYDLVYNPGETALVQAAREAGLQAATGMGMLVEQAALAFEHWTGCIPDREAMWAAAAG